MSEATDFMCRHFKNMCRHFKPSFFSSYTLSPCVDTSIPCVNSWCQFTKLCHLFTCLNTSVSCVDSWSLIFKSLISISGSIFQCHVSTLQFYVSTVYMCRLLKIMCRHFQFQNQFFGHYLRVSAPLAQNILSCFPWPFEHQSI